MVTQPQRGKTSRGVQELESKLATARPNTFDALEVSLQANLSDLIAVNERKLAGFRQKLLIELANSREDLARFSSRFGRMFQPETNALFLSARRDLRAVWLKSMSLKQKQRYVDAWLLAAFNRVGNVGLRAPLSVGRLVLDPRSFPAQLVVAILENWQRFAVCANPECIAPFFLSKRRTQKFCERGECTRYAQNQYALSWWKENRGRHQQPKKSRKEKA